MPCCEPSWNAFPAVLEIASVDERTPFCCLLNTEDPTIKTPVYDFLKLCGFSENVCFLHTKRRMGIYNKPQGPSGVGDETSYLDFSLVAWRFGTSLVLGLAICLKKKRLSPIVQHMFFVCFVLLPHSQMIFHGIQRYQLNPFQHSACSAWHFQPGGPFFSKVCTGASRFVRG